MGMLWVRKVGKLERGKGKEERGKRKEASVEFFEGGNAGGVAHCAGPIVTVRTSGIQIHGQDWPSTGCLHSALA